MVTITKPIRYNYPGWDKYPTYKVNSYVEYEEIVRWMRNNKIGYSAMRSKINDSYIFQVRTNHDWFILRWL